MDKKLYLDLASQLKTEVPELLWIDVDEGQLNEENPPIAYPCALIDIEYPNCSDESETIQLCIARVTIRYAFKPSGQAASATPIVIQQKALERWDIVTKTYAALQGWETSEASSFSRRSQTKERRRDKIQVIVQVWETTFEEEV
jgi:hypothetical protein